VLGGTERTAQMVSKGWEAPVGTPSHVGLNQPTARPGAGGRERDRPLIDLRTALW